MAELERLHSHVLWAGIAAKLMGFKTMFMTCFELREKVMDVLQAISGNRVNYSMNRIGGVNRDIEDPLALLAMVEALEREMVRTVIPIFTTSSTARSRCAGIGVLTHEKAISCGVVGPVARASGVGQDLRRDAPYAAYAEMEFDVPVQPDGDVRARLLVRALEIMESCKILRQALDQDASRRDLHRRRQVQLHHRHGHQPRRGAARRSHVQRLVERGRPQSGPRPRAHANLRQHAGHSLDGDRRAAGGHAADPGVHRPVLLLHRPVIASDQRGILAAPVRSPRS